MHPDWARRDTSTLAGMGGGGAPLAARPRRQDRQVARRAARRAPATASPRRTASSPPTPAALYVAKPSSCGRVVPTLECEARSTSSATRSAPAATGELCVRGSVVIKGYLNRPEATADAIHDGWFHTGDIARIDEDGFVFIVDRAKDMVLRGGENVYCSEVEAAIYEHPTVSPKWRCSACPTTVSARSSARRSCSRPGATHDRGRAARRARRRGWRSSRSPSGSGS